MFISVCKCLICLVNPSSLVLFVDKLDHDGGGFPMLFLMFSDFSCLNVLLWWVVVDVFVSLYCLCLFCFAYLLNMSEYKVFNVTVTLQVPLRLLFSLFIIYFFISLYFLYIYFYVYLYFLFVYYFFLFKKYKWKSK